MLDVQLRAHSAAQGPPDVLGGLFCGDLWKAEAVASLIRLFKPTVATVSVNGFSHVVRRKRREPLRMRILIVIAALRPLHSLGREVILLDAHLVQQPKRTKHAGNKEAAVAEG